MWIRLLSRQQLDQDGAQRGYQPGDYVNVGKSHALRWIASGEAEAADPAAFDLADGRDVAVTFCGTTQMPVIRSSLYGRLTALHVKLEFASDLPSIETMHEYTVLLGAHSQLRLELVPVGLKWLERWNVLAPVWSYDELARDIGTWTDREYAASVMGDLRVPVYDVHSLFLRRCESTAELLGHWQTVTDERAGIDPKLAFSCALWKCRPVMLPLPVTWLTGRGEK